MRLNLFAARLVWIALIAALAVFGILFIDTAMAFLDNLEFSWLENIQFSEHLSEYTGVLTALVGGALAVTGKLLSDK